MSEEIKGIKQWFELAKPNPTIEDACVQIGCHYEEVAEMLEALELQSQAESVHRLANKFKHKILGAKVQIKKADSKELLDALCDQVVTAVGVAHMIGFDIVGALNEVNASNYSKFENGKPVFNEQGKIAKGRDYFAPDLTKFIGK